MRILGCLAELSHAWLRLKFLSAEKRKFNIQECIQTKDGGFPGFEKGNGLLSGCMCKDKSL